MNQKFKKYFPPFIGILAVFAVWYIVCRAGILSSYAPASLLVHEYLLLP